jgi:UDPglucose 6-dehydrogenase
VLGAAFKPHSDDVRDSPALEVARRVHRDGADVRVFDPEAALNARSVAPELTYVANVESALRYADLVLHLTEWPHFAELDPRWAAGLVESPVLVDARNKLDRDAWARAGWTVRAIGRPRLTPALRTRPVDARATA